MTYKFWLIVIGVGLFAAAVGLGSGRIARTMSVKINPVWKEHKLPIDDDLVGIGGTSKSQLFIASREGSIFVLDAEGEIKDEQDVGFTLNQLRMRSGVEPWISANYGRLYTRRGGLWEEVDAPTSESILALSFSPDGTGWLGGETGSLFRLEGSTIIRCRVYAPVAIVSLAGLSAEEAFVSLADGSVYRIQERGESWEILDSPKTSATWNVLASNAQQLLTLAGASGIFSRIDGSWTPQSRPRPGRINDVLIAGDKGLFLASDQGSIFHNQKNDWKLSPTGRSRDILALGQGLGTVWASGADGYYLEYTGEAN